MRANIIGVLGKFKTHIKVSPRKLNRVHFLIPLAILISAPFILSIAYDFKYQGRVIPGVHLGEANLGGQTAAEALVKINNIFKMASPSTAIKIGPKEFPVTGYEFGFNYQAKETLQKLMAVGRTGSPLDMVEEEWQAWRDHNKVLPVYSYNQAKLDQIVATVEVQVARPAKDAEFSFSNDQLLVVPEEVGWELPIESIKTRLLSNLAHFDFSPVDVSLKADSPTLFKEDLATQSSSISALLKDLPAPTFNNQVWKLDPETALAFLKFEKVGKEVTTSYNGAAISDWLTVVAKDINTDARGQVLQVDADNKVVNFSPSQTGYELNIDASRKLIGEALMAVPTPKTVALVVSKREPPASSNSYGIKELIGQGDSNFYGSIPGRIHNIDLASSRIDGALIAPGEEVSFNKLVGEVSAETGYDEAYIISEGRTVLGTGGGLCQVSTTLFRAALNAGLPILARTAHAYRVHYYEPPVGLDATVYSPTVDMVFKNDTPAYILIQKVINIPSNYLSFRFYGTGDGRTVKMDGPYVTNQAPAPETLYQDDPTLPKGQTKQIDFSAPGADVTFYRKVTRGGEVLQDDTFVSHYSPWRAIFAVGTKE